MVWTNLSWSDGDQVAASEMNQMMDNFTAMAAGNAGAPILRGAAIEKEITFSHQGTIELTAGATQNIPSGVYCFYGANTPYHPSGGVAQIYMSMYVVSAWRKIALNEFFVISNAISFRLENASYYASTQVAGAIEYARFD